MFMSFTGYFTHIEFKNFKIISYWNTWWLQMFLTNMFLQLRNQVHQHFVRNLQKELIHVCVQAFVNILHVSRFRLNHIARQYHEQGYAKERRGGFRMAQKYQDQKADTIASIAKLNVREFHFCRGKTARYLPLELSTAKLYKMYMEQTKVEGVKASYFY